MSADPLHPAPVSSAETQNPGSNALGRDHLGWFNPARQLNSCGATGG